jgi:hypothetical protein
LLQIFNISDLALHMLSSRYTYRATERKGIMTPALKCSPLGHYDASPRHLAWAAGLFDGDGCVLISKQRQPGRKHPTYRLCLSVVQNCRATAERFQEILGLQSHLVAVRRTSKQNRRVYDVRFDGVHALRALQLLQPDLFRKSIEATVAIEAWSECAMGVLPGPNGLPDTIWRARERYYKKLRRLK